MKRLFVYLLVIIFFFSCAREKPYVKKVYPPPSETIALPEMGKGDMPEFYEVLGKRYYPLPDAHGFVQYGKASWYGEKFHGKPTSSGEIYNMFKKSAAHKILPMNTYVKVTNLSNKKYIIVRINDRGPFVKERVIDLSYAAAKEVDLIAPGVSDVKIVALGKEVDRIESEKGTKLLLELKALRSGEFAVQVGAFQVKENAHRLCDRLKVIFDNVNVTEYVDENGRTFYRVRVSKSETLSQAGNIEKELEEMGFKEAFIVRI